MGEAAAHRRKRTIGAAIWALVLLAALVVGLVYSESAQSYRRISTLSINELQVCRDGSRFQLGTGTFADIPGPVYNSSFQGAWREPFPRSRSNRIAVPPGSIATARTLTLNRHPVTFVGEDGFTEQDSHNGMFTIRWNVTVTAGRAHPGCASDNAKHARCCRCTTQPGVEDCFLRTLPSTARMVGKGSLTDPVTGTTASYAYITSCDPAAPRRAVRGPLRHAPLQAHHGPWRQLRRLLERHHPRRRLRPADRHRHRHARRRTRRLLRMDLRRRRSGRRARLRRAHHQGRGQRAPVPELRPR